MFRGKATIVVGVVLLLTPLLCVHGADESFFHSLFNVFRHLICSVISWWSSKEAQLPQSMLVIVAVRAEPRRRVLPWPWPDSASRVITWRRTWEIPFTKMWADHARRQLSQKEKDNSSVPEILDRLAAAGFNATADFPAILLQQEFLQRYPDSLVVLTVRSSAKQWAQSVNGTLLSIMKAMERVPFRWNPAAADTLDMMEWMFRI